MGESLGPACTLGALFPIVDDVLSGRKISIPRAIRGCITGALGGRLPRLPRMPKFPRIRRLPGIPRQGLCFAAGTKVITSEGEKVIEEVKVGDEVLASDPTCGEQKYQKVERTTERVAAAVVEIEVGETRITCTPEHPFWIPGTGWVKAGNLIRGSPLLTKEGQVVRVESVKGREGSFKVYNIGVERLHTYYVSGLGVLVHNARCPYIPKTPRNIKKRYPSNKRAKEAGEHPHPGKKMPTPPKSNRKKRKLYEEQQGYRYPERHPNSEHPDTHYHDRDKSKNRRVNRHHYPPRR
jgi:hypothetical protein